jgi:hypothetical protein
LFTEKHISNIEETVLDDFRLLAKVFVPLNFQQVALLLVQKDLVEICSEKQNKIQKRHFASHPLVCTHASQSWGPGQGDYARL